MLLQQNIVTKISVHCIMSRILKYHFYRGWYFTFNGTIVNIVLRDFDPNFSR